MRIHELLITYNLIDKYDRMKVDGCRYRTVRNSKLDCYEKLQWFLTESDASKVGYIEVISIEVNPL